MTTHLSVDCFDMGVAEVAAYADGRRGRDSEAVREVLRLRAVRLL